MKATISWWDLTESDQTIDSLRVYLHEEGVTPWSKIHGLKLKFWIADRQKNRWGAVMLWESTADLTAQMPPNRVAELIGYPPSVRMVTDVEAVAEGIHSGKWVSFDLAKKHKNAATTVLWAPQFSTQPSEPMALVRVWLDDAIANNVREPSALALGTADIHGHASNRIVQMLDVRDKGVVFTTHAGSLKGRQLAHTSWASGVLYWRETNRQVILTGPTHPLPDGDSDMLWAARSISAHPMSVISEQSKPLSSENAMRMKATQLAESGRPLARPPAWLGYLLQPESVEFWQADPGRLHQRLRYNRVDSGWDVNRLQP